MQKISRKATKKYRKIAKRLKNSTIISLSGEPTEKKTKNSSNFLFLILNKISTIKNIYNGKSR